MLLINRTDMLIVAENALGFFTGIGNVIPFSVDLCVFCRSFRVASNTTIKIYVSQVGLLVNEEHNVIKRNSVCDIRTTMWYTIIFRTQKRMSCKLSGITRGDYGFVVVVCRFLRLEKVTQFRQKLSTEIWS